MSKASCILWMPQRVATNLFIFLARQAREKGCHSKRERLNRVFASQTLAPSIDLFARVFCCCSLAQTHTHTLTNVAPRTEIVAYFLHTLSCHFCGHPCSVVVCYLLLLLLLSLLSCCCPNAICHFQFSGSMSFVANGIFQAFSRHK